MMQRMNLNNYNKKNSQTIMCFENEIGNLLFAASLALMPALLQSTKDQFVYFFYHTPENPGKKAGKDLTKIQLLKHPFPTNNPR